VKIAVQPRPRAVIAALTTVLLAGGGLTLGVSAASAAPGDVAAATLQWGFKQSFRSYISGPIAHGKWTLAGGVTDATPFGWSAGAGDAGDESGSVAYPGGIHFQGHQNTTTKKYDLDLDLTGVTVERTGADTASIIVDITTNSLADPSKFTTFTDVEFATVNLAAAADESTDTTIAFSGAPSVLTADGADAFSGFYEAGAALDPVSFSWPVEQEETDPGGPTDPEPQPDAPSVTVSKTRNLDRAGETLTITGTNFVADGTATDATEGTLKGGFGGAFVAFGKYPSQWRPSEGAKDVDRPNGDVKWLVNAADVDKVGGASAGAVALDEDGSFTTTLDVEPGYFSEPSSGTYGIYTYGGGGSAYAGFETKTTVRFAPVTATKVTLTASASRVTVGNSVTLSAKVSPAAPGTLVIRSGSKKLVSSTTGSTRVLVKKLTAGTHDYDAVFTPSNPDVFAKSSDDVSVTARAATVGVGSLRWGIKQSFREYVTGPIAKGAISTTGATAGGGEFGFGQTTGGTYEPVTGKGTSKYSGSVRFTGHAGLLDLSLSDPVVRVDSATSATLLARVNGAAASEFATLNLSAATRTSPNGTVAYTDVPAALTAGGASVFSYKGSSFYQAGTALDPVTFVIGARKEAPTSSATVAAFETKKTAATTVPTADGITLAGSSSVTAGDEITATAEGFQPNEQNVLVVIYSTPTVLADNATADASGRVSWTGALPAVLTGTHTLTFQGSVSRGVELTIAAAESDDSCAVTDAAITWGFKESFRSYISGSIANGKWEVADGATYSVPNFGFADGAGSFDGTSGTIAFPGSITFTGHEGILNTTVANPTVRLDGDTAILSLDVSGTTQEGEEVSAKGVEFVSLDISGATTADGVVTITDAPATLTAAGAAAFGTYETGEAFDPVTLTFTTPADCGAVVAPVDSSGEPTATATDGAAPIATQPVASETIPVWAWIIIALLTLILAAAVVLIVLTIRRPRAVAPSSPTSTP